MSQPHKKSPPLLNHKPKEPMQKLLWVMECLRDPDHGCPWDLEQTYKSIAPYTIEEAYEVADALENGTMDDFKEELGDLLLQVVYQTQMATEDKLFNFQDVADAIAEKMIARHPHVFGDEAADKASDVNEIWDRQKEAEQGEMKSALDGVTLGLPALLRAQKLQKRAARVGYEWPDTRGAQAKLEEELAEFEEACEERAPVHMEEELGDVLFCVVNYGRMHGLNAEEALRKANNKFYKRFSGMEDDLKNDGIEISKAPLEVLLNYWKRQKHK